MPSSSTLPPLSLSILGVEPLDEFILEIASFIHHTIKNKPSHLVGNIEVEVKIGLLKERGGSERISLPTLSETSTRFKYTPLPSNLFLLISR
jgi:polynucleotide 5'-triphosphatase